MVLNFFLSLVIVGIIGSLLIYSCKKGKKELEEKLKQDLEKLDNEYRELRVKNNEEISMLKENLENLKSEYSKKRGKVKGHILY